MQRKCSAIWYRYLSCVFARPIKTIDTLELADRMVNEYNSILERRKNIMPRWAAAIRRAYDAQRSSGLKKLIKNLANSLPCRVVQKKYLVVGLRFKEVLTALPPAQTLLIASNLSEILFALKNGYSFTYLGMAGEHFLQAYYNGTKERLQSDILKVATLLANENANNFVILSSDTKPLDILFRWVAGLNTKTCHTVFIQHGVVFDGVPDEYLMEGTYSQYFLAMSASQVDFARKLLGEDVKLLECGPPWNLQHVDESGETEVILVSNGGWDADDADARTALEILHTFSSILKDKGVHHVYRPHPAERSAEEDGLFDIVDTGPKERLLSGKPKIFVGFSSTLLFEAYLAGHTIVGIPYKGQDYTLSIDPDFSVSADNLGPICEIIADLKVVEKRVRSDSATLPLSERLNKALLQIERSVTV